MAKPIVTLTLNPAIDGAAEAEVVKPINKIRTSNERYDPGGGGINVTRVVKELGGESVAVYLAGGATGSVLDDLLGARGIARRRIPIAENTRVAHVIYERTTGLEYRFIPEGPEVSEREWQRCIQALDSIEWDFLVGSGSLPRGVPTDFYVRLNKLARDRGSKLVLDTSGEPLRLAMEAGGIFLVKPSQSEFEKLIGVKLNSVDEIREAAAIEVKRGRADMIAVTLGHEGAVLAHKGGVLFLPAMPVKVISASGAGDSFVAGITYGISQGRTIEDAFALGVACGTAAVVSPGTQLCAREDVDRIYEQIVRDRVLGR